LGKPREINEGLYWKIFVAVVLNEKKAGLTAKRRFAELFDKISWINKCGFSAHNIFIKCQ